jgi:hypothetical protein
LRAADISSAITRPAPRLRAHDRAQADRAGADHDDGLPDDVAGLLHRVHPDRERLDQRPGLGRKVVGQLVQQFGRHVHVLRERTVVHQPGERQVLADVVHPVPAIPAGAAMLARVGRHALAEREAGDARAERRDFAAEFVAEDALAFQARERVRRVDGDEHRPGDVFVQVGAADPAPVHADLDPAGRRVSGDGNLLDADVVAAVPDGGLHAGGGMRCRCTHVAVSVRLSSDARQGAGASVARLRERPICRNGASGMRQLARRCGRAVDVQCSTPRCVDIAPVARETGAGFAAIATAPCG